MHRTQWAHHVDTVTYVRMWRMRGEGVMAIRKVRTLGVLVALVGTLSAVAPLEAGAAARNVKVPGKPIVTVIEATQGKRNTVNIRVQVQLPAASPKAPITGTEVRYGTRTCNIRRAGTSCLIRGVPMWGNRLSVTARTKNKAGFGKASKGVRFNAMPNRWIRTGYNFNGVKIPPVISAVGNTRVLISSEKWTKMESLQRSGVQSASASQPTASSSNASGITFRTDGMVGLATADGSVMSASGLYVVRGDGSSIDAVASGSASIQDFYMAPNNRFYVVFKSAVEITPGDSKCALAEVDADTGNPRCVDYKVANMANIMNYGGTSAINPGVQFDAAGNIYYIANLYDSVDSCPANTWCNTSWRPSLRKSVNGNVVSLLTDYVQSFNFLVQSDGSVIVTGRTSTTNAAWTRRISPQGVLGNIEATRTAMFLKHFADGNVYMGLSADGTGMGGVRRFMSSTATLDPKWWISSMYSPTGGTPNSYFTTATVCSGMTNYMMTYCSMSGSSIKQSFNFGNAITLVVPGSYGMTGGRLMQYYPSPELIATSITNVTVAEKVGNKVAIAGTTADGVNSLVIYDPFTFQETIVMDASNQIEIYSMAYVASTGKLMFNGLNFATNSYVMGEVTIP